MEIDFDDYFGWYYWKPVSKGFPMILCETKEEAINAAMWMYLNDLQD